MHTDSEIKIIHDNATATCNTFKSALNEINFLFAMAEAIWTSLPAQAQSDLNKFYKEECSLGYCLCCGYQAAGDFADIANKTENSPK